MNAELPKSADLARRRRREPWLHAGNGWQRALDSFAEERDRWALWLPVLLGIGIAVYFALPVEPVAWAGSVVAAAALLAALSARRRPLLLGLSVSAAALGLGFAAAQLRAAIVAAPVIERETGPVELQGRIRDINLLPEGVRLVLDRLVIADLASEKTPERARIRLMGDSVALQPGDSVRLRATLAPPSPPVAPGAYDFQRDLFFRGIGAVGFAFGQTVVPVAPAAEPDRLSRMATWLSELRLRIAARVRAALPDAAGAVAVALIAGDQGAIPKPAMDAMRDSGLSHLLSISGLHIGLVAGILFVGLRALLALVPPFALNYPIKKWAAVAALLGTLFYLLLAGAPVPTQRSYLMTGIVLLAVLFDRKAISMRTVALAAAVVLLVRPDALVGASFQMSFAAVVALVAAYETSEPMRLRWRASAGWLRIALLYGGGLAAMSLIATAATSPFVAYHFDRFTAYGVFANMLAVPLTSFWVMPWAVLAVILMPFGLASVALIPMGWGIEGILWIAEVVAALPGAVSLIPAMPVAGLVATTVGGLWFCLWQRPWRLAGLPAILLGLLSVLLVRPPDILVSENGRLVAVADGAGNLLLSSRRTARFEAEAWLRRAGEETALDWPADGYGAGGRLACDRLGCIYRTDGWTVAIAHEPEALFEDCAVADIVLSLEPVRRPCRSARRVIDRFDLWRNGAYALWVDGEREVRIESVRGRRGDRPWVVQPGRTEDAD